MGLESGNMPSDLNVAWPLLTDPKVEGPDHFQLIKRALKNWFDLQKTFGQFVITNQPTNTVTVIGTGSDTLVPPTGYVPIPGLVKDFAFNGLESVNGGIQISQPGYYRLDGWLSCKTTAGTAAIAVVFAITRNGVTSYTPRPTPAEVPGANELGLVSGGGFFAGQEGDVVTAHIASSNSGTITIPNANLRIQWMAPL